MAGEFSSKKNEAEVESDNCQIKNNVISLKNIGAPRGVARALDPPRDRIDTCFPKT